MSSPSQKHGSCGHIMASFDSHGFCARCRDKGKGSDPCTSHIDCNACNSLTEEQCLSTPSYRIKKEKLELKKSADNTPQKDSEISSLIHPSSVVGAVDGQGMVQPLVRVQAARRRNLILQIRKFHLLNTPKRSLPNRLHPTLTDLQLTLGLKS